jgi:glutamine synthetase
MVNVVLNTIAADAFKDASDRIEGGQAPHAVARQALRDHWSVIFNGDNYDEGSQAALTAAGVWRIDSGVDAMQVITAPKNTALLARMGVLSPDECAARQSVMLGHYTGTVLMEVRAHQRISCYD